jgi:hypothetical protein
LNEWTWFSSDPLSNRQLNLQLLTSLKGEATSHDQYESDDKLKEKKSKKRQIDHVEQTGKNMRTYYKDDKDDADVPNLPTIHCVH